MSVSKASVRRLTESGILLAIAFVLSVIRLMRMPFGGSITLGCMFPVILLAYRYGTAWGLFSGLAFALLQLLTGLDNLSYATSFWAAAAILLLDYLIAYTALGLGGIFRRLLPSQSGALLCGTLLCCVLRYLCHVVTGCTVWAGVAVPTAEGLVYSLTYNAAYMIPETLITAGIAWYLGRVVDFRPDTPRRVKAEKGGLWTALGLLAAVAAVVIAAVWVVVGVQTEEGFVLSRLADPACFLPALGILALGAVLCAVGFILAKRAERR